MFSKQRFKLTPKLTPEFYTKYNPRASNLLTAMHAYFYPSPVQCEPLIERCIERRPTTKGMTQVVVIYSILLDSLRTASLFSFRLSCDPCLGAFMLPSKYVVKNNSAFSCK